MLYYLLNASYLLTFLYCCLPTKVTETHVNQLFRQTMFLESTLYFSPSTSSRSLYLWLTCSCLYHIFFLCWLTTLTICNFGLFHSLLKTYLVHKSFQPHSFFRSRDGLHYTRWFLLSISAFYFSSFHYCFCFMVPCGRLSWLPISSWSHENIVYHIV